MADSSPNNTVGSVHKPVAEGAIDPTKKVLPQLPVPKPPKPAPVKRQAWQREHKPGRRGK